MVLLPPSFPSSPSMLSSYLLRYYGRGVCISRLRRTLCGAGHVNRLLNTRFPGVWFSANVIRGSTLMVPTKRNTLNLRYTNVFRGWISRSNDSLSLSRVLNYADKKRSLVERPVLLSRIARQITLLFTIVYLRFSLKASKSRARSDQRERERLLNRARKATTFFLGLSPRRTCKWRTCKRFDSCEIIRGNGRGWSPFLSNPAATTRGGKRWPPIFSLP